MSKLIVLGDSFCHGIGLVSVFKDPANTQLSFGRYVADRLGFDYVNLAEPGSSVGRTMEIGFQYLSDHYDPSDTVIVGWTSPLRLNVNYSGVAYQILPEYTWLGELENTDVASSTDTGIKCVTDISNEKYLDPIGQVHRAFVENDLFLGLENQSYTQVQCFKSWMREQSILFKDFAVFANQRYLPQLHISFVDVMPKCDRHPSATEQQAFAELMMEQI